MQGSKFVLERARVNPVMHLLFGRFVNSKCHVQHLLHLAFVALHDGVMKQCETVLICHLHHV